MRFVILHHRGVTNPHFDLMLQLPNNELRTWQIANPSESAVLPARAIVNHRSAYLQYEGPISGGRGFVKRWDRGIYLALADESSLFRAMLRGEKLHGILEMRRDGSNDWSFQFQRRIRG